MALSDNPRKGIVVQVDNDTGRIQPDGERSLLFYNRFRLRAVVLNEFGEPTFGSKSTGRGLVPVSEGEEVMYLPGRDEYGQPSVRLFARLTDWLHIQAIGKQHRATTTTQEEPRD